MFQLKKREKRMDVDAWVQSFLHTMGAIFDDKVILRSYTGRNLWGWDEFAKCGKMPPPHMTLRMGLVGDKL